MKYLVNKDFGDVKAGEEIEITAESQGWTPEQVAEKIQDGTLSPEITDVEYEDHTVTAEDLIANPAFEAQGIKVGDIIQLPKITQDDVIVKEPIEESSNEDETIKDVEEVSKTYLGQTVISEDIRNVNGKDYHVIRVTDGSTYDLTDEEYELAFNK
jgi:hypothetical protein